MSRDRDVFPVLRKAAAAALRGSRMPEQAVGLFERAAPDDAPALEMDLAKAQEMMEEWALGRALEAVPTLLPPIQAAVVDVLGDRGSATALVALEGMDLDRHSAKAVSHALGPLRARGLAPPQAPRGSGLLAAAPGRETERLAFCTPHDAHGQALWMLVEHSATEGTFVHSGMIDERIGFAGFTSLRQSRKAAKEIQDYYRSDPGLVMTAIPVPLGVRMLLDARARAEAAREPPNQAVVSLLSSLPRSLLDEAASLELPALREATDPEVLPRSLYLLTVPSLRAWALPADAVEALRLRVAEAASSSLVLAGTSAEDRIRDVLARGTEDLMRSGWGGVLSARLRHLGTLLLHRGIGGLAAVAFGVAEALREGRPSPWRIPVVAVWLAASLRMEEVDDLLVRDGVLPPPRRGQPEDEAAGPGSGPDAPRIILPGG
ncbi:hypothetical protein L6R50_01925 [Myxococcota bacterium]|nr:hypothetical protein [Myxococcota bacterium]